MTRIRVTATTVLVGLTTLLFAAACGGSDSGSQTVPSAADPAPAAGNDNPEPAQEPQPAPAAEPVQPVEPTTHDEPPPSAPEPPAEEPQAPEQPPDTPPEPKPQEVVIKAGEPIGGVARIEAKKGDIVTFAVRSDIPEEIHVHGFDVTKNVRPGRATRFRFEAAFEGIFEVEAHNAGHVVVAKVVVKP